MNSEAPVFKIKTGQLPVLILHVLSDDLELLQTQLAQRLAQTPDFFASTPIVLDLAAIAETDAEPDFSALLDFMRAHGMCASGMVGGSASQRAAAARAGLGLYPETPSRDAARRATDRQADAASAPQAGMIEPPLEAALLKNQPELPGLSAASAPAIPAARESVASASVALASAVHESAVQVAEKGATVRPTLVIDRPVRTGQSIYAEGANLVLLAIANAGSELIADGDIHVYAPLRGKAIAGARGNESARIFVNRLEAELLSIAGCFKVFEDGVPEDVRGKAAQIHLDGNRLVMQPLPD